MKGCVRAAPFPWRENVWPLRDLLLPIVPTLDLFGWPHVSLYQAGRSALASLRDLQRLNKRFAKGAVSLREFQRWLKAWAISGRVPRRARGVRRHQRRVKAAARRRSS